jgi:hypothetical protein
LQGNATDTYNTPSAAEKAIPHPWCDLPAFLQALSAVLQA